MGITTASKVARERDISFEEALNSSVRRGVDLDKALRLAGELEGAETMRKLQLGK